MDIRLNKNVILIASGAGMLLLLGGAGFLLVKGVADLNSRQSELQSARQKLQTFYRKDPFPSDQNLKREMKNVKSMVRWFNDVLVQLREGQITSHDRKPSKFKRLLEDKRKISEEGSLTQLAHANSVTLAEDFGFGFEWYVKHPDLPSVEDVPILTEQLLVTETLCKVLFEERIKELVRVEREEFEVKKTRSGPKRSLRRGQKKLVKPGILEEGHLHAGLHFKLIFKARQDTLLQVLDRLASHETFIVVTGLDIRTDFVDEKFLFDIPTLEKLSVEEARQKNGEERLVTGAMFEELMTVTLDVDVYKFAVE